MKTALDDSLIPGTFNARDLGGMTAGDTTVRRGALIRSDAPVELGDEGRRTVTELGIRTAVDLREPVERAAAPPDFDDLGIALVTRPLLGEVVVHRDIDLRKIYDRLLDDRGAAIAQAVASIADAAPEPVIIFCSAGKDRTGVLTALVLSLLGVDDDQIVADYHRTEANMRGGFQVRIQKAAAASGLSEQQLAVAMGAPVELMRGVLAKLRAAGGAEAYLTRHGLPESSIQALRTALLEP